MPRLESECEDGDGITLDFRIKECKLDNDHNLEEKFRCLASWTDKTAENNYTFVVLADNRRFPVRMRLEGNLSDLERANIFRDGKCVVNDRDAYSKTKENVDLGFEKKLSFRISVRMNLTTVPKSLFKVPELPPQVMSKMPYRNKRLLFS